MYICISWAHACVSRVISAVILFCPSSLLNYVFTSVSSHIHTHSLSRSEPWKASAACSSLEELPYTDSRIRSERACGNREMQMYAHTSQYSSAVTQKQKTWKRLDQNSWPSGFSVTQKGTILIKTKQLSCDSERKQTFTIVCFLWTCRCYASLDLIPF